MKQKKHDTLDFAVVDVRELRAAHEAQQAVSTPERIVLPNGDVLESLNAENGTYRITDHSGALTKGYTREERIEYKPTLNEQYIATKGAP